MKRLAFDRAILIALFVIALVLATALQFWNVSAQGTQPQPAATPQAQPGIDDLRFQKIEQNLDEKLQVVTFGALGISALAAFFGWKAHNDLKNAVNEKVQQHIKEYWDTDGKREMGKRIYGFDPSRLTIWLPDNVEIRPVEYMLRQSDFENITPYNDLETSGRDGIVVVMARSLEEEQAYVQHVQSHKHDLFSIRVAFVLYTGTEYKLTGAAFKAYPMMMPANMPATVTSAILTLARALHPVEEKGG